LTSTPAAAEPLAAGEMSMRLWLFDLTTRERRTMTGGIVKLIGF
jgi:hypothetical protein